MKHDRPAQSFSILPFAWSHWRALWELRHAQLAEAGIILSPDELPAQPVDVDREDYEWDYHHIAEVYLRGAGGFWLAWWEDFPVGHIAGQDLGGAVELRHMYVRADYRRHGIGAGLVRALIDHCRSQVVRAVELWTGNDGPGRKLYERMGFHLALGPGKEFLDLEVRTNYVPGKDEIRMRIDLG